MPDRAGATNLVAQTAVRRTVAAAVASELEGELPLQKLEEQLAELQLRSEKSHVDVSEEIATIESKIVAMREGLYRQLGIWDRIQLARHPQRPYAMDYIGRMCTEFQEIHGDRLYGDDQAMVCGPALLDGDPIMVIGQQKGRSVKENIWRNFGCPHPEGYRKALRAMKMAEKFAMPIICLIDTAGAYPGIGSEERHIGAAIAVNLREMITLAVPSVGVVIGEGGSGGALGIGVVDRLLLLENAYYSVISPEGCAAILWNDRSKAADAANSLRLTPEKLLEFSIADEIIAEPIGGAHMDHNAAAVKVKEAILRHLNELKRSHSLEGRYERYRSVGAYAIGETL
ncbi:MAG: acetyl-CoA carboxylase carboxyltransferase subunit alpha [Puniceicoccales bacterium]|jgi:acetyl-CoA carboxylase carboxyl transferase subunit alpha|nr:acetyl-CoA carboxylase carboxyltransferase subunit alpha [Puniceicoccales bacterium]